MKASIPCVPWVWQTSSSEQNLFCFGSKDTEMSGLRAQLLALQQEQIALREANDHLAIQNQTLQRSAKKSKIHKLECNAHTAILAVKEAKAKIFHLIKFIPSQEKLDDITSTRSIGSRLMNLMSVGQADRESWWETCKDDVCLAFNRQRCNCTTCIKKVFAGEFGICLTSLFLCAAITC